MFSNRLKTTKALVVEDSLVTQRLMTIFLEHMGFDVEFVENGRDALIAVKSSDYNIIFLDVMIPIIDGYRVCKTLKASALTKDIPVIMLTSKAGMFDKVRGKMAGTDIYLTKPIIHTKLLMAVNKFFPITKGVLDIEANDSPSTIIEPKLQLFKSQQANPIKMVSYFDG